MSCLKQEDKKGGRKRYDPYIAFRQCPEKMKLRKNREKSYETYVEIFLLKKQIEAKVKIYKSRFLCEQAKHELLKKRFKAIDEQYKRKEFDCVNFEQETTVDIENLISNITKIKPKIENKVKETVSKVQNEPLYIPDSEKFAFHRKAGSQFYSVMMTLVHFFFN
jgi:hypothetical protein